MLEFTHYWLYFKRKIRKTVIESSVKSNESEIEIIKHVVLPKLFKNEEELIDFLINADSKDKEKVFKISDEAVIKLIGSENFNDYKDVKITVSTISKILSELFNKRNEPDSDNNTNP